MSVIVSSQGFEYGVKHFFAPTHGPVQEIVQNVLKMESQEILILFGLGSVYINNTRWNNWTDLIPSGAQIRVHTKPRRFFCNYDWRTKIVFQNEDFLILNKPAGLPSHPSVDNKIENSLTQTEKAIQKKLLISHRLDTTTEGLIVYGLNSQFVREFNQQLQAHQITKKYVALIENPDRIERKFPVHVLHSMEPSPRAPKKVVPHLQAGWDLCELIIEEQKKMADDRRWTKINLLTGRTHQIRSQMAERGTPIVGDKLYGARQSYSDQPEIQKIALKAQLIEFKSNNQIYRFELNEYFEN